MQSRVGCCNFLFLYRKFEVQKICANNDDESVIVYFIEVASPKGDNEKVSILNRCIFLNQLKLTVVTVNSEGGILIQDWPNVPCTPFGKITRV